MNTSSAAGSRNQAAWLTSGGANSRSGAFGERVEIGDKPARVLAVSGAVHGSVIFDRADKAFVADMGGAVQAFTSEGRLLWRRRLEGGVSASPALHPDGETLFAGTHAGWVYGLDAASGTVRWRTEIPTKSDARILSDLLVLPKRGAVVLSSWGGRFVALECASGRELQGWDAGISPAAAAAADADENVYCLRAVRQAGVQLVRIGSQGTESVIHQADESEGPANRALASAAPVLDRNRGMLYFAANSGRAGVLNCWSLRDQKMSWSRRFPAALGATPAVAETGGIALPDMAGVVHGLAPDGSPVYRYVSGSDYILGGAVCEKDGRIFFADPLGMLHVITAGGVGRAVYELPRSAQGRPSFDSAGNLYVPGTDARVYVFSNRLRVPRS